MKNGTRLRSQVCSTELIVVRTSESLVDLRVGGLPVVAMDAAPPPPAALDPAFAGGNSIGKRYTDDLGAEVLVTKAGSGTISVGHTPLVLKSAKPLPASD